MTLPSAPNSIAANQINVELGKAELASFNTNETAFRELCSPVGTDPGSPPLAAGSTISYDDARGKSRTFILTIESNVTTGYDVRALAVSAGWNQSLNVTVRVNSGVVVSNSLGYAMTVSGSFPGGVRIENSGFIIGTGGTGGSGGGGSTNSVPGQTGGAGVNGGNALLVQTACEVLNSGTIAGGGGGGAGGGGIYATISGTFLRMGGNGGSGGAGFGIGGPRGPSLVFGANINSTGSTPKVGNVGGLETGGNAPAATGFSGIHMPTGAGISGFPGNGGGGGDLGAGGSTSAAPNINTSGWSVTSGNSGANGAAGIAINGNNRITFLQTGTILGPVQNN